MAENTSNKTSYIVDIGQPGTWPDAVIEIVDNVVEHAPEPDWREYPFEQFNLSDFREEEHQLYLELSEYRIVGYHATRLLPHEISNISNLTGLQVLTESLRQEKVRQAIEHFPDAFTHDHDGEILLTSGPNPWQGFANSRLDSIDFVAPFIMFDHDACGLFNMFDTWGGETFYSPSSSFTSLYLTKASEPAIVEIAARVPTLENGKSLLPAFAGVYADIAGRYWGQWRTLESISPEFVIEVITTQSNRWPPALHEYRS